MYYCCSCVSKREEGERVGEREKDGDEQCSSDDGSATVARSATRNPCVGLTVGLLTVQAGATA